MLQRLFGRKPKPTYEAAPIIDSPPDRGYDRDYRRTGDDPSVIRINQKQPKGFPRKVDGCHFIPVAGVSYRQPAVLAFIDGSQRRIEIEPEGVKGELARAVFGRFHDGRSERREHLGYVPREFNEPLGEQEVAGRLEAMYRPTKDKKTAGLRISLWEKAKPRVKS